VVGAYRRYAEWLVSVYTQAIKNSLRPTLEVFHNLRKKRTPCIGFDKFLNSRMKPNEGYLARFYSNIDTTLPQIIEWGPSKLESKILNYFQLPKATTTSNSHNENDMKTYNSISTELYCDALGTELVPHTCSYAREIESRGLENAAAATAASTNASSTVTNKGSTSTAAYQHIVAAGFRLGFLIPTDEELQAEKKEKKKCRRQKVWCDSTKECSTKKQCVKTQNQRRQELDKITSDGKVSIIGTNSSNIASWKDLYHYDSDAQKLSWTERLPIQCPSRKELEKLLQKTLDLEELVMPEFYATPLGKDEHERLFWDVWDKEKKLFCWVDIEKLFRNAKSWDEIIHERMVNYDWTGL